MEFCGRIAWRGGESSIPPPRFKETPMKQLPLPLVLAGTVISAISNSLSWISAKAVLSGQTLKEENYNGWDRDGALIFGLLAITLVLCALKKKVLSLLGVIFGLIAVAIAVYDLTSSRDEVAKMKPAVEIPGLESTVVLGPGMYLAIAGAAVALIGAILRFRALVRCGPRGSRHASPAAGLSPAVGGNGVSVHLLTNDTQDDARGGVVKSAR
jgi:hypothetical protein